MVKKEIKQKATHQILYGIFYAIIFTAHVTVCAAPHRGDVFELKQPDGTRVTVKAWGDEYYQRIESIDGYSLVRNEYGWICYADLSADGNEFLPTDIVYEGVELDQIPDIKQYLSQTRNLKKGLKINHPSRMEKLKKRRDELSKQKKLEGFLAPAEVSQAMEAEAMSTAAPLTGSVVGLTILVDFPDEPAPTGITPTEVDNYCNQVGYSGFSNNGSVRDYFYDVSNEIVEYTNVVMGYYTAQNNKTYYDDCDEDKTTELIQEALTWLDGEGFDFTQLTTRIDYPSTERIFALNIFYAGSPDCGWSKGLWPHRSWYGGFTSSSGIKSGNYQITNLGTSLRLGTFCHENGHMICSFPDLYDYGYESDGIGDFGLMAAYGSSLNPVPPNPYLRDLKGWETMIEISTDAPGTIRNHQANSFTTYRYSHPTNSEEFFLIESRMKSGRNASLPDEGLLIWHIDEAGSNDNEQMTPEQHYKVSVEQADGLFTLENSVYTYGGPGDLFHAGYKDAFNDTTLPDAKWWDGSGSGLAISNIGTVGTEMSFVMFEQATYPPVADSNEIILTDPNTVQIRLTATDDGYPVLPGELSYIITSLPEHGWLFDPNDGLEIVDADIPYTLQNDSNSVIYRPCPYYFNGTDSFAFKANDGGIAPDGGDSNIADVNVVMNMLSETVFELDGLTNHFYVPFQTQYKQARTQLIYLPEDVGASPRNITEIALKVVGSELGYSVPDIELQSWKIQMQHTGMDAYPASAQFINDGWVTVYDANEPPLTAGWNYFKLERPFEYDGASNLLVDLSFNNSQTTDQPGRVYQSDTGAKRKIFKFANTAEDPNSWTTPTTQLFSYTKNVCNVIFKTSAASEILKGDFNVNCSVGTEDLMTMVDTWLAQEGDADYNSDCDISVTADNRVDLADFAVLASEWLLQVE